MSYECQISFKTIEADKIYAFFQKFKEETVAHFKDIAKENAFFCPAIRFSNTSEAENNFWAFRLFSYRYFYLPEHKLLGVFGVADCMKDLFDNTTFFQNNCDQDYDYETWLGIPVFEEIATKWSNASRDTIKNRYNAEEHFCDFDKEYEDCTNIKAKYTYWRKSFAYKEIWEMFSRYLYNDEKTVYISLFSHFEEHKMHNFVCACMKSADEKLAKYKEYKERNADNG